MNRQEYTKWANAFRNMYPDTGAWLFTLPDATRDMWFREVFSKLEIADVQAATLLMMDDFHALRDRERIPAILAKLAGEVAYKRRERERAIQLRKFQHVQEQQRGKAVDFTRHFDSGMKAALCELESKMKAYREENDVRRTPPEMIEAMMDGIVIA